MSNPKVEAQAALKALKEQLTKPALTELERLTAMTFCDFALANVNKLAVARPRKNGADPDL